MQNGVFLGTVLILIGGIVSWYTGMLLIEASAHTGRVRYEDIAKSLYGRNFAIATAAMNIFALVGFNMSYTVYVRLDLLFLMTISYRFKLACLKLLDSLLTLVRSLTLWVRPLGDIGSGVPSLQ